jgi:hypothetical protein
VPEVVLDYHCDSPVDMERTQPELLPRRPHGIATTTYQSWQPPADARARQFRVPGIERLYLSARSASGRRRVRRGRATAMVMAEDLGIEFDRIASA